MAKASEARKFISLLEEKEPQRQAVVTLTKALDSVAGPLLVLDRSEWGANVPGSRKFDFEGVINKHNLTSLLVVSVEQGVTDAGSGKSSLCLFYFARLVEPGRKVVWHRAFGCGCWSPGVAVHPGDTCAELIDPRSPDPSSIQAFYERSVPALSMDLAEGYATWLRGEKK
jgi:hypothetical protein